MKNLLLDSSAVLLRKLHEHSRATSEEGCRDAGLLRSKSRGTKTKAREGAREVSYQQRASRENEGSRSIGLRTEPRESQGAESSTPSAPCTRGAKEGTFTPWGEVSDMRLRSSGCAPVSSSRSGNQSVRRCWQSLCQEVGCVAQGDREMRPSMCQLSLHHSLLAPSCVVGTNVLTSVDVRDE